MTPCCKAGHIEVSISLVVRNKPDFFHRIVSIVLKDWSGTEIFRRLAKWLDGNDTPGPYIIKVLRLKLFILFPREKSRFPVRIVTVLNFWQWVAYIDQQTFPLLHNTHPRLTKNCIVSFIKPFSSLIIVWLISSGLSPPAIRANSNSTSEQMYY